MSSPLDKVTLSNSFDQVTEHWTPAIVAELNGQHVKVAKLLGEFTWHRHEDEDEMFWVVSGQLAMHLRDRVVHLGPGELLVVPRGVEHKPVCESEVEVVLFEPAGTVNTGDNPGELTVAEPVRL